MKKLVSAIMALALCCAAFAQPQYTNIPTIYINTENNRGVYDKENYVPCKVTIVTDVAEDAISGKDAGIRGRGNSTWNMAKKPYRLKFDKKINLFNRPAKAKSWTLLANYADKTLMRNAVAFELSRFMGFDFSPTAVFVDVVLNGAYLGNYMVSDQMEVNKGRVDIDEMDETCTEGESLTGGYFLEIDGFGGSEPVHFNTTRGLIITVKSPDDDIIKPVQLTYIKNFIQNFENTLFRSDFADPQGGFRALVDEKTLVDWYIACELTGNPDSFWSTYVYKKRSDDHLYFGPLWDFDIAFNNDNRLGDAQCKLMRDNAHDPKTWIKRIWQAAWFQQAVCDRWRQLRSQGIEEHLLDFVDTTAEYIDESQRRNFTKWPVLNSRVYLEQFLFPTYQQGVDFLKQYIHQRAAFLDLSFCASTTESVIADIQGGQQYYIMHHTGLYATSEPSNFYIENPLTDSQRLTFVAAPTPGYWNIRTHDGRYLASITGDKYCTYTADPADSHAQFAVEPSPLSGYARIRNAYTGKCLGVEHTNHYSRVSTDKDGSSSLHAWKILPTDFTNAMAVLVADPAPLRYDPAACAVVSSAPTDMEIYNLQGMAVASARDACSLSAAALPQGVYIARSPRGSLKFVKR